jgi:hypothetical protein
MAIDVAAAKRRLMIMGAIDAICVLAALSAIGVYIAVRADAALVAFAAALVVGFAAQIWFVAGLRRAKEGA